MSDSSPSVAWQSFSEASVRHLELHLARLEALLGLELAPATEQPTEHPEAAPLRPSLAELERALSRLEVAEHDEQPKASLPLIRLTRLFGLSEAECDVLLLAVAPAISESWREAMESSSRYGKLDVATAVRLMQRCGLHPLRALELFEPSARLRQHQLIRVFSLGRAEQTQLLSHRLQAPMRVAQYLLGRRCLDDALGAFARLHLPEERLEHLVLEPSLVQALLHRLRQWLPASAAARAGKAQPRSALSIHLRAGSGLGKTALVRALARELGLAVIECDCALLQAQDPQAAADDLVELLHAGVLLDALVVFDRIDALIPGGPLLAALRRGLESVDAVVFLLGEAELSESTGLPWRSLVDVQLNPPDCDERENMWKQELRGVALADDVEAGLLANQYPLSGAQIRNATRDALLKSNAATLSLETLSDSASDQLRADLSEYARPRSTKLTLEDLVLPPTEKESIREIITACKQRASVLHKWGLRRRLAYGTGIVALFAGEPGTGKTLSSQIIAEAVGMSLFQIAIPSIVSKWIGETERNISLIFRRARASKAILLLDEADSLLATRTEVKDATDRYANMSTNQLLQEIETFEGVVLLTSNREQNLDPAAERRILFRVHFPFPGPDERAELWRRLLPPEARPKDARIDVEHLGELYELSGGHIKNVIMRAAYAAMDAGVGLSTEVLSRAAEKECRAIGKLIKRNW